MIIDRTQTDVDEAIRLRNEKIKFDPIAMEPTNLEELTEEELEHLKKGTFNTEDLNRIEGKQAELANLINGIGYWNTPIQNKTDWTTTYIFTKTDFQSIIDNENILRNAFFTYNDTPITPDISFHYKDINSLEKILVDLDVMINDVKSNYRECGNFECGQEDWQDD